MGAIYLYIISFWPHWWPTLPTAALFGVGETAALYSQTLAGWIRMIPNRVRRPIELLILFGITFYAGFQAWKDEHASVLVAQRDLQQTQLDVASLKSTGRMPNRELNDSQIEGIWKYVCTSAEGFLPVSILSVDDPPALHLGRAIIRQFNDCGIPTQFMGQDQDLPAVVQTADPSRVGLFVPVFNKSSPDERSATLLKALTKAGFDVHYSEWETKAPSGFVPNPSLFISRN